MATAIRSPAGRRPPQPAAIADVPTLAADNPMLLVIGVMIASLLQVLDSTIANVAIPHMQATLGATSDEISWVLTSYIVATAVAMPITGWLADRIGSRRLFIMSVTGFILSSMLCGMAQNIGEMVLFRAFQGASGAFISPLSQAAMIDVNRPSRQAQMMAVWAMGVMIGPIAGPLLGGWLTDNWNWRAVFYVNVPLGAVALAILLTNLPSRAILRRRFDLAGFAMIAVAVTAFQLLLDRGNQIDWFQSWEAWAYAFLAISAAWMGMIHFLTVGEPLFNRALFANRNFVVSLAFMMALGLLALATMALLPQMLQSLFGYSVMDTGWVLMPRGVSTLVAMQIAGLMVRRGVDPRPLVGAGFLLTAWSMWQMTGWSLATNQASVVISGVTQGFGLGFLFMPLNSAAFATLAPHLRTEAASLLNLFRSVGSSAGISLVTALLARNIQTNHEVLAGHVTGVLSSVDYSAVQALQAYGGAAMGMIDSEINRQAAMIGYLDDYYLMAWLSFLTLPLVLLMQRSRAPVIIDNSELSH